MAGKNIKGITIEIAGDVRPLNKALEDVDKKSKTLQGELKEVEKLLKFNPDDTVLLAQKQELLAGRVEATRERLNRLKDAQEQVEEAFRRGDIGEEQYRAFQRELVETESKLTHFERKLKETKTTAKEFGREMQHVGDNLKGIGKDLALKVTAPLTGVTAALGGMVASFGWGRLKAIDTAQAQLKGLGYAAEDVERISKQVSNAIQGTVTTMAEGTATAAGALAAGVKEGAELEQYIRRVSNAAVGAKRPVEDMAQIFNRIQGSGKLMTDELNTIEAGMPGFAQAMADSLGVAQDEFRKMVSEGKVSSKQFMAVMDEFAGGMADAYAESWDGMTSNVKANIGIIGQSLLSGVFEQSKESVAEFLELLRSREIRGWAKEAGASIGEAFTSIVNIVKSLVEWFTNLSPNIRDLIVRIGLLAVAVGPLLMAIGSIVSLLGSLSLVAGGLGLTLGGLLAPIAAVVAAIGGLIFVGVQLYKHWDEIKAQAQQIWADIKNSFLNTVEGFREAGSQLIQLGQDLYAALLESVQSILTWFSEIPSKITAKLNEWWEAIQEWFDNLVATGREIMNRIIQGIKEVDIKEIGKDIIRGLWNGILSMGETLKANIIAFINEHIPGPIKKLLGIESPSRVFYTIGQNIIQGLVEGINDSASEATYAIKRLADQILNTGDAISTGILRIDNTTGETIYDQTYDVVMKKIDLYYRDRDRRVALMTDATEDNIKQLQREIEATQKATDIKIKLYEQEYRAKAALIDEESNERIRALQREIDEINKLNEQEAREREEQEYEEKMAGLWAEYETAIEEGGDAESIMAEIQEAEEERRQRLIQQERRDRQEQLREEIALERERALEKKKQLEEELEEKRYNLEQQRIAEIEHMNQVIALMQEQVRLKEELEKVQTDIKDREQKLQSETMSKESKEQTKNELEELKQREKDLEKSIATNQANLEAFTPRLQKISNRYGQVLLAGFKSTEQQIKSYIDSLVAYMQEKLAEAGISGALDSDGSHAKGLSYVPYDNYRAILHEGERVLTKAENREYAEGRSNKGGDVTVVQHIYSPTPDPRTEQRRAAREFKKLALGV